MTAAAGIVLPYRACAAELPPLLCDGDAITVRIGTGRYPGVVVGVVDEERVRVFYADAAYHDEFGNPLLVERTMSADDVTLEEQEHG